MCEDIALCDRFSLAIFGVVKSSISNVQTEQVSLDVKTWVQISCAVTGY